MSEKQNMNEIDYGKLLKEFALLRRPYVTLADAVKNIEENCVHEIEDLRREENFDPFNFNLYQIQPHHENGNYLREIFRYLPGYDNVKFKNILENEQIFKLLINKIFIDSDSENKEEPTSYYKNVIQNYSKDKVLEFLHAVYYFTYSRDVIVKWEKEPLLVPGIVHEKLYVKSSIPGNTAVCYKENLDNKKRGPDPLNLPSIKIKIGKDPQIQIPNTFSPIRYGENTDQRKYINAFTHFFEWLAYIIVGNVDFKNAKYKEFILYIPVHDGLKINEGVLRGYLSVNCSTETSREKVCDYLSKNFHVIQSELNTAFIKGAHNGIVEQYMGQQNPIEFWKKNLYQLHNWDTIEFEYDDKTSNKNEIWWCEDQNYILNLTKVLKLQPFTIERLDLPEPGKNVLKLSFPSVVNIDDDSPYIKKRMSEIVSLLGDILVRWQVFKNEKKVIQQSRKAAISQVMSRNLSHNLGSHVLANLTQPQTILDFALENKHENLSQEEKAIANTGELTFKNNSRKEININSNPISFNVAIAELNSYVRTRMDFLADISTGTAVIETTKEVANDVINLFNKRAVLLKRFISGNDKNVVILNPNPDPIVAFPNDNLGVQALYIIIENVIRNSSKHGKGNKVSINWEINSDIYPDLIELVVYDEKDKKNTSELNKLVEDQNIRIEKDMLDNGVLRHGSWGMLEMKVAAAYLRKEPVEKIDGLFQPSLLKAVPIPEQNGQYLGYKFYLLKPKHLLVVLDHNSDAVKFSEDFLSRGIEFITLNDLQASSITKGHDIVMLVDCNEENIQDVRKRLSARIVITESETLQDKIKEEPARFINWAWEEWFKKLIKKTNPVIVYITKDDNESQARKVELKSNNDNGARQATFVYHCKWYRERETYFEAYSSLHPSQKQIDELSNSSSFELKGHFLETINYTVAVADERIQKHADGKFDGGIADCNKKHLDFLNKCGIDVPPIEIDLNAKSFDEQVNDISIKQLLQEWCELKARECEFLVIHIGIIERILGLEFYKDEEKPEKIEEYLRCLREIDNRKAEFIITSGRGQPESLPKGERFVHYSNIAQYVIEKRSKFHLIQLLISARETK